MAEVVAASTRFLSEADLAAMATRIRTLADPASRDPASGDAATGAHAPDARAGSRGAALYERFCSDCHGKDGAGVPGIYPALAGNRAVTLAIPANLIRIVSDGGFPPSTPGNPMPFGMPPFAPQMQSTEIAEVITHIRQAWGNTASTVTSTDVTRSRP